MENLFKILLAIHIVAGSIGLIAGTVVTFAKKGNKLHKLIGKFFSVAMLSAGVCSLALAIMHRNDFLLAVGILTIYMAGTGWRYLYLKNIATGQRPIFIDWLLLAFMVIGSIVFIVIAILSLKSASSFAIIILIFAVRGVAFVIQDFNIYRGNIKVKNYWLLLHLQRMMGAYIASLTAFLVVNFDNRLSFIAWLLPSAILVPFIVQWSKKYKVPNKL